MGRERTFQREEMLKREGQRAAVIMASVGHDITSLAPVNVLKDTQAVTVVRVCGGGGGGISTVGGSALLSTTTLYVLASPTEL